MCECDMCEEKSNTQYNGTRYHSTYHSARDKSCDHHPIRSWWDEYLFDSLLELRHIKRRHHMRKWIHDKWHHDEPRNDELHIVHPSNITHAWADELSEYDIVECGCDNRRDNRLPPYAEKALDFLTDDSHVWDVELRWIHRKLWAHECTNYEYIFVAPHLSCRRHPFFFCLWGKGSGEVRPCRIQGFYKFFFFSSIPVFEFFFSFDSKGSLRDDKKEKETLGS